MKKEITDFIIISKYNTKIQQKKLVLDRKYAKMMSNRKEKLDTRKEREMSRFESKMKKKMDIELHNLTAKRPKKMPVDKWFKKDKQQAFAEFQLYCKLVRAENIGWKIMCFAIDTQRRLGIKKVQWGHIFSKHNYPQLAFYVNNCRPITPMANKLQWDQDAGWIGKVPLPVREIEYMKHIKEQWDWKFEVRTKKFYQEKREIYKKFNENEMKRLWVTDIKKI